MEWAIKKGLWKAFLAILAFVMLVVVPPPVLASYEVSDLQIFNAPPIGTDSKWTSNLEIRWTAPTIGSGYTFQRYVYLWNNNATAMTNLDRSTLNAVLTTEPAATKQDTDLTAKDYSLNPQADVLYLHVKTEYLDNTTSNILYSNDTVLGPFQIDNVAPSDGTVRIVDGSGNVISLTASSNVNVNLAASGVISKYYLSESESLSTQEVFLLDGGVAWGLSGATIGNHTLYAWFEDPAGNKSSKPATSSVMLASISIKPYKATIDLAAPTQTFQIDGSTATDYTWSFYEQKPETVNDTVAEITGSTTGNSITVTALKRGTFKLKATKSGQEDLLSDTITVAQTTRTNSIVLTTGWNWVSFNALPAAEARTLAAFFGANAGLVQQVKTQTSSATNTGTAWIGDSVLLDRIAQGAMFKIKVSSGFTLDVTGLPMDQTTPITLSNGWTWAAYLPNAVMNWDTAVTGIMGTLLQIKSQTQSKTKSGSSFVGDMTTMAPGKGYAIRTSAAGALNYPAP